MSAPGEQWAVMVRSRPGGWTLRCALAVVVAACCGALAAGEVPLSPPQRSSPPTGAGRHPDRTGGGSLAPVPGSFFVTLAPEADPGPLRGLVRALGAHVRHEYRSTPNRFNIRDVPPGLDAALARAPGVIRVERDFVARAALVDSVPLLGALFTDPDMRYTDGGLAVGVCVLDTGLNRFHTMFDDDNDTQTPTGKVVAWKDFVHDELVPFDNHGHGSHVAGIIFGRLGIDLNGEPFQGMAPKGRMIIGKVLGATGTGAFSDVQAGIEWCSGFAPDSPFPLPHIINLSLGGGLFTKVCDTNDPTGTAPVVNAAAAQGILVVAAAGNDRARNAAGTPACASGAVAVGATHDLDVGPLDYGVCQDLITLQDQIPCFSNRWDFLDVSAPGCLIHSAGIAGNSLVVAGCGTSQAAAHVSGLAALVIGANRAFTATEVRQRLIATAVDLGKPGFDRAYGHGRIVAAPAVGTCIPFASTEQFCGDGFDDDCDNVLDCADTDCCGSATCAAADADGDGFGACDCDDGNAAVWLASGPVTSLSVSGDTQLGHAVLAWGPPPAAGAFTSVYDVLRSADPTTFSDAATVCLETGDGSDRTALDEEVPLAGGAFFYQVRAANDCPADAGALGADGDGVTRVGRACP